MTDLVKARTTENDLTPGAVITYIATSAFLITPHSSLREVTVVWVGQGQVHYRNGDGSFVAETSVERFLEIVNKPPLRSMGWGSEDPNRRVWPNA